MKASKLVLISHHLCPYVQRSLITLTEKDIPHERINIDLANKPEWFLEMSPTGKVPVLKVDDQEALFESAVICEYLDEVTPGSLHPSDPLEKAKHRAWIEYGSQLLNDISSLYNASSAETFTKYCHVLQQKLQRLEQAVQTPLFAGQEFSMVDAAYGPIFRYFDVIDSALPMELFARCSRLSLWRFHLSERPSVQQAVSTDYRQRLRDFLLARNSYLSDRMQQLMIAEAGQTRQVV